MCAPRPWVACCAACNLDELPQLLNVLRGEMSLVGPRPERPAIAARIQRKHPNFARRLAVRPGIAGLAQSRGRFRLPPPNKLRYDLLYIGAMGPLAGPEIALRVRVAGVAGAAPVQANAQPAHGTPPQDALPRDTTPRDTHPRHGTGRPRARCAATAGGARVNVLVTGGAGFIGSALIGRLAAEGHRLAVVDDGSVLRTADPHSTLGEAVDVRATVLRTARASAPGIPEPVVLQADVADPALAHFFAEVKPEAVVHLAARADVTESVRARRCAARR